MSFSVKLHAMLEKRVYWIHAGRGCMLAACVVCVILKDSASSDYHARHSRRNNLLLHLSLGMVVQTASTPVP